MSTLRVANVHFESTGANRIDYTGTDQLDIRVGGNLVWRAGPSGVTLGGGSPTGSLTTSVWSNGESVPNGYLRLDGNNYSRTTYAALSNVIKNPVRLGDYTSLYLNTGLLVSDVYEANGVLFHNGTAKANGYLTSVANSLVYSVDGGVNWILTSAQGVDSTQSQNQFDSYGGKFISKSRVASNGTGTFVITNGGTGFNGITPASESSGSSGTGYGNAYVMVSTTNLNTWSRTVFTGGTGGFASSGGSFISAVGWGGTQNRFVALFNGGRDETLGEQFNRIGWSNNGTTWTFQTSNTSIGTSRPQSQSIFARYIDLASSSNGFVALTTNFLTTRNTNSNSVFTSADGIVWTDISANASAGLTDVTVQNTSTFEIGSAYADYGCFASVANGFFILAGGRTISYSNNRTNWTAVKLPDNAPNIHSKIQHNGKFYYYRNMPFGFSFSTTTGNTICIFDSLSDTTPTGLIRNIDFIPISVDKEGSINLIPSCNIGNVLYGQANSNISASSTARMGIYRIDHNTYDEATQFTLPNGTVTIQTSNPLLPTATFIKT